MTATSPSNTDADVIIVGGGPAGLSAATALRRQGVPRVTLLEREAQAGGIPRHTEHIGYGIRDLHRVTTGPRYADALRAKAHRVGVTLLTNTTAVDWADDTSLIIADSNGTRRLNARAVILATGVRERPRSARLIPGDRGLGVFTTGSLQQLTALHHQQPGKVAVVVGAEHVSFSAVMTLEHAGCQVAAMITKLPEHQTYAPLKLATTTRHKVPIIANDEIAEIHGRPRVQAVTLASGRRIACDTVVFTGDWIPDNELARRGGVEIDEAFHGPIVDQHFRTTRRGVFAAGNMVHPAETADVCALDGRSLAKPVAHWLATGRWIETAVPIRVSGPLSWVSPGRFAFDVADSPGELLFRVNEFVPRAHLELRQGSTKLYGSRVPRGLVPNRSLSVPADSLRRASPLGESIVLGLRS